MKKFYVLFFLVALVLRPYAQGTILDQGDLVVVGVNANNGSCGGGTGEDRVSFISFVPITTGTVLHMTDNGWERCNPNQWGDTEGFYVCTYNGTGIPAGQVFTFTFPNSASPSSPGWTFSTFGTLNLNSGGDQLYVMQGGTWNNPGGNHNATYTGGRFLVAFNTKSNWVASCSSNATQNSNLHSSVGCIAYVAGSGSSDFLRYNGPLTATNRYEWFLRITDSTNWTTEPNCTAYNSNFTLTSIPIDNSTYDVTWTGATDNNWFNCNNWNPTRVPNEYANVIIPNVSNHPIIDHTAAFSDNFQDTARCNNIIIDGEILQIDAHPNNVLVCHGNMTISNLAGSELDMSDGNNSTPDGKLFLKGNWINNKNETDFKQGNSTVIFWGGADQTISTADTKEVFYNFIVSKSGGTITLNDHVEVGGNSTDPITNRTGVLTLTNGNIITGANNLYVTNPATGAISGGSSSSFVDGNLRRHTNTANLYDFPVGEGTRFMKAGVRPSNTSENVIQINAQNSGYGTYTPLEPLPTGLVDVSTNRWWDITKISGSSPVAVRLYWNALADDGIVDAIKLVVAHWSDRDHSNAPSTLQWWNRGRNAANSTGTIANGFVESSETMTNYSPFTFGTNDPINPLPVELISFTGVCKDNLKTLFWTTASETNNAFFSIQRSDDGINYQEIARIPGAGNSNVVKNYSYQDVNKSAGTFYYQLVQTDINGTTEIFDPISVSCESPENTLDAVGLWAVYPNLVMLYTQYQEDTKATLSLMDLSGCIISSQNKIIPKGSGLLSMDVESLNSGIYIIILQTATQVQTVRFVIP